MCLIELEMNPTFCFATVFFVLRSSACTNEIKTDQISIMAIEFVTESAQGDEE